jgi:hypothetical protein
MLEGIKYPFAYFDFDDIHGECTFEVSLNEEYDITICHISAWSVAGETELEYILTDAELEQLGQEIYEEVISSDLIDYLEQIERDYMDDLNYECSKHDE